MNITIGLVSILALTLATAYFVAQEFAYVAVDRGRLSQLADEGDAAAARALSVTGRLSFALSGAQLGITVTALLVGYVSEPYLGVGLAELITGSTGVSEALALSLSVLVALVLSTVVQMVVGELAPKNYAIARPVALARALSRSTVIYLAVAGPVIRLFDGASTRLLRSVGIEPVEELPHGATPEDLHRIIGESHAGGLLDENLSHLLDRGLAFRHLRAGEVMTPRVDAVTVPVAASVADLVGLLASGHSRFPVTGDSIDDVVGMVGTRELLRVPLDDRARMRVEEVMVDPVRVPSSLPLPGVLTQLRHAHQQLAVVVDEYGGLDGIISLEDVAEEVVGDIRDEGDQPAAVPSAPSSGGWSLPARLRLDEVADTTGVVLPDGEDYDTLGGLVLARLGRVAVPGDRADVEWLHHTDDDAVRRAVRLTVEAVARHVPETVRLTDLGPIDDDASTRAVEDDQEAGR
ncbi:hemolysin family protein [Luteipulveratus sp. YIM 133132]|uniref:Hemolysin family protein n=1 Tax=Luteipulveratus flavus TaxID=3031728 RepID=A0ABT6C437_9MICO|nr:MULTISPECIES: hemolysin family protein [unclassified Luteipulveratus]MDE9364208.1 hemolysin family protein [Luteipulveratus sp. YIM 133132]MDF8263630.1 hemolysin family protein [Luteipulveratus sp. YIM 133296]